MNGQSNGKEHAKWNAHWDHVVLGRFEVLSF